VGDAPLRVVFCAYKGLVEGYTARKLTFPGDVLNAFAGVFSVVRRTIPSGDICGLPGAFLDLALLWTPIKALIRREQVVIGGDPTASDGNGKCPSWSWAGFAGACRVSVVWKARGQQAVANIFGGQWLYHLQQQGNSHCGWQEGGYGEQQRANGEGGG